MTALTFRKAGIPDIALIIAFVYELAAHEGRPDAATIDAEAMHGLLFGTQALADAYLGFVDDQAVAYAIVTQRFSSFRGTRRLYIEDMLVHQGFRQVGLGKRLLTFLAQKAIERGFSALEWSALDDNDVAIGFYDHIKADRETGVLHFSMSLPQLKQFTENIS